jgi:drug/metabolite transporter (DMT)-like permease
MPFVLASIACSIAISIVLKLMPRGALDVRQAIVVNYLAACALCAACFQPSRPALLGALKVWDTMLALSILLPAVFIALAAAVRQSGMARTDAAQRLSLVIPLAAAFMFYGEALTRYKLAGLVLALLAIVLLLRRAGEAARTSGAHGAVLLAVWAGYGAIDFLFKRLALAGAGFTSALVVIFAAAALWLSAYLLARRVRWDSRALLAGVPLGALNFAGIFFYVRAHQYFAARPSVVFVSINLGVLAGGIAVGLLVFREPWQRRHWLGALCAAAAVGALSLA